MNPVLSFIRREGGVVRSARLRDAGFREVDIRRAVESGAALRVRRRWLALPDADPMLIAAARNGVLLSCITEARRLGVWVVDDGRFHVAAHAHAGRVQVEPFVHIHRAGPLVPRHPDMLTDPVENVLASIAVCRPYEEALAAWESAIRQELVDPLALARLPIRGTARRLLDDATPFSDSGLESIVRIRLRWTRLPIVAQLLIAGHHVDFLIGERLVLQVDGGHHVGAQRASDVAHDAELALLGYTVIRVTYHQVMFEWPAVQDRIARAIAQGLHRAR